MWGGGGSLEILWGELKGSIAGNRAEEGPIIQLLDFNRPGIMLGMFTVQIHGKAEALFFRLVLTPHVESRPTCPRELHAVLRQGILQSPDPTLSRHISFQLRTTWDPRPEELAPPCACLPGRIAIQLVV